MKRILMSMIGVTSLVFMACQGSGDKAATSEAKDSQVVDVANATALAIDKSSSVIEWIGAKPTGKHNGRLMLKDGVLYVDEGKLLGGKFTLDMKSIVVDDLTDPDMNAKLTGHLHSDDFFSTESHPDGSFEITKVEEVSGGASTHNITGNLTIKGISRSVTFPASITLTDSKLEASSLDFTVDRTEWDIRYKSTKFFDSLKDDFINDEIGLKIKVTAGA